jgi:23S rRNA pseudouridine955/2504/2580 synthase
MSNNSARKWAAEVQRNDPQKIVIKEGYEVKSYVVPETQNQSVIEFIAKKAFGMKKKTFFANLLKSAVWVEGSLHGQSRKITDPKYKLSAGDKLSILFKKQVRDPAQERRELATSIKILYKDERIIVIDKPITSTHGGTKNLEVHLESVLHTLVKEGEPTPKIVHRLDKDVTGCMILARTPEAAAQISTLFKTTGAIRKVYLAMIIPKLEVPVGQTEELTTGLTITKNHDGIETTKMVPWNESFLQNAPDIKKATTKITVLSNRRLGSAVLLEPVTGRKHQLRVHMSYYKSFILGDFKYGPGCTKKFRHQVSDPKKIPLHLHSYRIVIKDWYGEGKDLSVHAPLKQPWKKTLMSSGIDPAIVPKVSFGIVPKKVSGYTEAELALIERDRRKSPLDQTIVEVADAVAEDFVNEDELHEDSLRHRHMNLTQ